MAGYKIGDKNVAKTLVRAGKERPWERRHVSMSMGAPDGIFLRARLGIVKDAIDSRTEVDGTFYPATGTVYVAKMQDGGSGAIERFALSNGGYTEETVLNFSETSFESGELVMTLTDVFNKVYILSGKAVPEEGAVLCKVVSGSSVTGYSVGVYANGAESDPTGSGTLFVAELALGAEIPVDSWVIGHPMVISRTGGDEE